MKSAYKLTKIKNAQLVEIAFAIFIILAHKFNLILIRYSIKHGTLNNR